MVHTTFPGSNINLVKAHNQQAILLSLLYESQVSRVQLAEKTGLSTTTITNLVTELLEMGLVLEEGTQPHDHHRKVGRPRTALRLVPSARYAIGVHIGVGVFRVALVNICAEMQNNSIHEFPLETPAPQVLDHITEVVEEIIVQSRINRKKIVGVGVGASGLVNYQTGVNLLAPNLGWQDVHIREYLNACLDLPVIVDNNVRAMALGEAFFGCGRGIDMLAFVYGRIGVGAGFVFGGNVFRGSNAGAGEIGHITLVPYGGELCRCGKRGCLETLISEPVIIRQAESLASAEPDGLLAKLLYGSDPGKKIDRIFTAARSGDQVTKKMIEERASYLGIALATLVNLLNPELILLGGMFAQGEDLILPKASEVMRMLAFGGLGERVRVTTTSFGWQAGVLGAASLALINLIYQHQTPLQDISLS